LLKSKRIWASSSATHILLEEARLGLLGEINCPHRREFFLCLYHSA
jgi:hypothetical protein